MILSPSPLSGAELQMPRTCGDDPAQGGNEIIENINAPHLRG